MKNAPRLFRPAFLACVATMATQSAVGAPSLDELNSSGWFIRAGAVARFNVKASVSSIPPASGTGLYDDGYVLPDNGGTASGRTWNWGYHDSDQVVESTLVMKRFNDLPSFGEQDVNVSNPLLGGEIIAGCYVTQFAMGKKTARVGFELGTGYSEFSENLDYSASGTASHTTDRYELGDILPPIAPYYGTAQGPGPLINLSPGNSTLVQDFPGGSTTAFQGSLKSSFYNFRFGPTLDLDLSKRLGLAFGFGYCSVYADAQFSYAQSVTFSDPLMPALAVTRAELSNSEWHPGVYVDLRAHYQLTKRIDLYAGGDFQHNNKFRFGDVGHEVSIDLGTTYSLKAGINCRF